MPYSSLLSSIDTRQIRRTHRFRGSETRFAIAMISIATAAIMTALSFGASWLVVAAILSGLFGISVAHRLRNSSPPGFQPDARSSTRSYLIGQLGFSSAVLTTVFLLQRSWSTSDLFVMSWTVGTLSLFMCTRVTMTKARFSIVSAELLIMVLLAMTPAIVHHSTYHGGGDLLFHESIVDKITSSGEVPESIYKTWPGWHIGVGSLAIVSGMETSLCSFLFVGIAISLALPFVGLLIFRLSDRRESGAMAMILLGTSAPFLISAQFLTPTVLSFGLFAALMWTSRFEFRMRSLVLFTLFAVTIIVTHHLSSLILVFVLIIGTLLTRQRARPNRGERELNWRFTHALIVGIAVLSYWIFTNERFYIASIVAAKSGFESVGLYSQSLLRGLSLGGFIISFSSFFLIFMTASYIFLRQWKKGGLLGIGPATTRMASLLGLVALGSFIAIAFPLRLFDSILVNRWMLFGWLFVSVGGTTVLTMILHARTFRSSIQVLLSIAVLFAILSGIASASLDTLPLREDKQGTASRPFFLESEVEIARFVEVHYSGTISCDSVFLYYFFLNETSNLITDDSAAMLKNPHVLVIVRMEELSERGLIYRNVDSRQFFITRSDLSAILNSTTIDKIADTGTTEVLWTAP